MSDALAECQSLRDACQRFAGISKQPFGHGDGITGTHARVVPAIDEPMGLMSVRIIQLTPYVGVVAGLRRLTGKDHR